MTGYDSFFLWACRVLVALSLLHAPVQEANNSFDQFQLKDTNYCHVRYGFEHCLNSSYMRT